MTTWKPKVGSRVKLDRWDHYTSRNLSPWGWFEVLSLGEASCRVKTVLCAAGVDSVELDLPYDQLQKPLYWQPFYQMKAGSREEALKLRSWLTERGGIAVWGCEDLSQAGRVQYTPGDTAEESKPHWSYALVEVVTDPARCQFFFTETRKDKPKPKEKSSWLRDRIREEYYREVPLES